MCILYSRPSFADDWRGKLSPELNHRARAGYFAYLAYIDAQVGRFTEFLSRSGLLNNSMLAFTSDHGEMLGDQHLWRKVSACDPSARIPFIIRPPSSWTTRANQEDYSLVGLEDIMPTFLDTAGVDIPDTVEGQSLVPLLKDEKADSRSYYHHEHSPCYTFDCAYQSVTSKEWKYIWNPINGSELLFDRKNDQHELCDLASDCEYNDVLAEYRAVLACELQGRPEQLSDGERLKTGSVPAWRAPQKNLKKF